MITSIGTIDFGKDWGVLKCSHELGRYLRYLYQQFSGIKLQRPSNGEHITIVSPHENFDLTNWKWLNDTPIRFFIDLSPQTNGNAIWYPVQSHRINEIRLTMGLSEYKKIPLHFCIGYKHENESKNEA